MDTLPGMIQPPTAVDYQAKASSMWAAFNANDRAGVRFGMFPFAAMKEAERVGYTDGRRLSVALMDCATRDGGMRA